MGDLLRIETQANELRLSGEFDRLEIDRFTEAVRRHAGRAVEIDLSGLTFVDSSAMRELISARQRHPRLRFVNPTPDLKRLAEIAGVTEILFGP